MARTNQKLGILFLTLGTLVSFQNCGRGVPSGESVSSTQSNAKVLAQAASFTLGPADLSCGDFNQYTCEQRVSGPNVADLNESIKECLGSGQTCVDVDILQFNTPAADAHEEFHCSYRKLYRGISLEGSGGSIEASLAKAMVACEQAVAP